MKQPAQVWYCTTRSNDPGDLEEQALIIIYVPNDTLPDNEDRNLPKKIIVHTKHNSLSYILDPVPTKSENCI